MIPDGFDFGVTFFVRFPARDENCMLVTMMMTTLTTMTMMTKNDMHCCCCTPLHRLYHEIMRRHNSCVLNIPHGFLSVVFGIYLVVCYGLALPNLRLEGKKPTNRA
jgi:hypothetical protein